MSDFHAIGGVSASLKALLRDRMEIPAAIAGGTVAITIGAPPAPPDNGDDGAVEEPRVNLFLYQVTRNGSLSNQEIPGNGHPAAYGRPPLPLDLHYMLTAYGTSEQGGETDETVAHFLLGSAMRVFHDLPTVTEDLTDADGGAVLHPSLHGEYERIKISLDPITLEDLAKVWTATTFPYRLSAAYTVSVVQIESQAPRRHPQPVAEPDDDGGPRLVVLPLTRPLLSELRVHRLGTPAGEENPRAYAAIGDDLILLGSGLAGGEPRVWIGTVEATAGIGSVQSGRMIVTVPDHPDLQPGPQTVSVTIGASAFRSNLAVFVLVPRVDAVVRDFASVPRRFTLAGARLWSPDLTGETLVADEAVTSAEYLAVAEDQIVVPLPDSLPAWPVLCLRSGAIPGPIVVPAPELQATIEGTGPLDLEVTPAPTGVASAGLALQRALRSAEAGGRRFTASRVAVGADRLWVVPGELGHTVQFSGPAAGSLELTGATGAAEVKVGLSGRLRPLPRTTAAQPKIRVKIGGTTRTVTFAGRPTTLEEAAILLRDAIRADGPPQGFAQAEVVVLGDQLLIVPGVDAATALEFGPVHAEDETSVAELRLSLAHRLRVRVNGVENVDHGLETLP